ncbi:SufE family protein [Blattabacterium cuenoti]|uniref:SufE family protein n=1 Tax=Blattabacterium cuenoti TaxID=1653831 RepID=UPI00163D36D8|nr:SufE family protein [Blattabacterium cuenoti]
MNLLQREKMIKYEFESINGWEEKYQFLIDLGDELKKKSDEFRSNDKLIDGCQSKVWLDAKLKNKRIFFYADSDALLPKGMIVLIIKLYSGLFPKEIIHSNNNIIYEIGLTTFLSPIRSNGILLFLNKIKFYSKYLSK